MTLNPDQRKHITAMLHLVFREIRQLGWEGKSEQAADLADTVCALPLHIFSDKFNEQTFIALFLDYQNRYPERSPQMDYAEYFRKIVNNEA